MFKNKKKNIQLFSSSFDLQFFRTTLNRTNWYLWKWGGIIIITNLSKVKTNFICSFSLGLNNHSGINASFEAKFGFGCVRCRLQTQTIILILNRPLWILPLCGCFCSNHWETVLDMMNKSNKNLKFKMLMFS